MAKSNNRPVPRIEIVITPHDVESVRLFATNAAEEEIALHLYTSLRPWLAQVRALLAPVASTTC